MPGFEHGYKRGISEIIGGILSAIILNTIVSSRLLDPSWMFYFKLLNTLGTIVLILAMPYWGTTYLLGWLFALIILFRSGLVGFLDLFLYFGIPLIILIIRIVKCQEESTYFVL